MFCSLKFFSESLGMQTEVYVLLPQRGTEGQIGVNGTVPDTEKFRCLYLLHGLSDDHTIWMRRTSIERYAEAYGIAMVMPCAAKSFYTDMKNGDAYYTFVAKELPARIRSTFNISGKREDNFVAGLSMGGYGALKIGLRECESFEACAALSPVTDIVLWSASDVMRPVFGEKGNVPDDDDVYKLVEKRKDDPHRPRIFLACGKEDPIYRESLKMKDKLEEAGYGRFKYMEGRGTHEWAFWDVYIQHALEFFFK